MAASDLSTFDAFVKVLYSGTVPGDVAQKDSIGLNLIPKKGGFVGKNRPVPVMFGNPQGRSRNFSKGKANASGSESVEFTLTRTKDYGFVTIDAEAILSAKKDLGAFKDEKKAEIDGMLEEMGSSASRGLYRNKYASIGVRGSVSGEVITLLDPTTAYHFSKNMVIGAATAGDESVLRVVGAPALRTITAVDADAGTITLPAGGVASITAFADNDFLHVDGDHGVGLHGFAAWLPLDAPTPGDSHFGVDRSDEVRKLSGVRRNKPNDPIWVNIMKVADECATLKGRPNVALINHRKYTEMVQELGSRAQHVTGKIGEMGFTGIKINYSKGSVVVIGDPDCPSELGYVLDMRTWTFHYLGSAFIHMVDDDGRTSMRINDEDGIEIRIRNFGQPACNAPGKNGVFAMTRARV
jgi:hypothetical protein